MHDGKDDDDGPAMAGSASEQVRPEPEIARPESEIAEPEPESARPDQDLPKVDPQPNSLLFQRLPQEMRNRIYRQVFSSTRFNSGLSMDAPGPFGIFLVRPPPNGLSLLLTCRRAHLEIGDSWLRHVLFIFQDAYTMLDTLSALPIDKLSQIRHLRVRGDTLKLFFPSTRVTYCLAEIFKLLPGLQLDQLTVIGSFCTPYVKYETISGLVEHGDGWKTLRYINYNSDPLGFASRHAGSRPEPKASWEMRPYYWRKPQPQHWQAAIEARDGAASGASVIIYRAKLTAAEARRSLLGCSILNPNDRVRFRQPPGPDEPLDPHIFPADPELMSRAERDKALMVVVKRGAGVDYQEKADSPFAERDIRRELPGRTWQQIRGVKIQYPDGYEGSRLRNNVAVTGAPANTPIRVDIYRNVDEDL
jgi:hypothetical protein